MFAEMPRLVGEYVHWLIKPFVVDLIQLIDGSKSV